MATVAVCGDELVVALGRGERLAALRRAGDLEVPLDAVREVRVAPDALRAARGLRAPGVHVPRWLKVGTWRGRGRRFVLARRGVPAVHVRLAPGAGLGVDELLVSDPAAAAVVAELQSRLGLAGAGPGGSRELELVIRSGDRQLGGSLALPPGEGPFPAALIVPGSGDIDRDANHRRMALGISRDLAGALAAGGIASLRYDKRGVGASGGSYLRAGVGDNVADARAALLALREHSEVREDAVVLIGHSEGAYLVAELGGDPATDGLAGVVLLSGAAKTGEETLRWQARRIAPTLPGPVRVLLRLMRSDVERQQARALAKVRAGSKDVMRMSGRRTNARWMRELLDLDPRRGLARIDVPVLAVTGDKDLQVDPDDLETIAAAVGGPVETWRVPQLTHILRRDPGPPALSAYKRLVREPVDAEVLERVVAWVRARTGAG